jgi:hypothetical protein
MQRRSGRAKLQQVPENAARIKFFTARGLLRHPTRQNWRTASSARY